MTTILRYWDMHCWLFQWLGSRTAAYGVNIYGIDLYPWEEHLTDTLALLYD